MKIEAFTFGQPPLVRAGLASVVVRAENGTPIMVALEMAPGGPIEAFTCNDAGFQLALKRLGINETVVVERLDDKLLLPHELPKLT